MLFEYILDWRIQGPTSFSNYVIFSECSIPWLFNTVGAHCFFCEESISHFFLDCSEFRDNFASARDNLNRKLMSSTGPSKAQIANFIHSLHIDRHQKALLLLGAFASPLIKQMPLSLPDSYPLLFLKLSRKTGKIT